MQWRRHVFSPNFCFRHKSWNIVILHCMIQNKLSLSLKSTTSLTRWRLMTPAVVSCETSTGWLKKVSCCTVITAYFFEPPCISLNSITYRALWLNITSAWKHLRSSVVNLLRSQSNRLQISWQYQLRPGRYICTVSLDPSLGAAAITYLKSQTLIRLFIVILYNFYGVFPA